MSGKRNINKIKNPRKLVTRLIAKLGRPVIRHLSDIACESLKQPGSWRCLEMVYRNEPRTLLDRFFLSSRSARGARNRLLIFQEEICRCIEQCGRISNPVKVVSLGSGPGHEIIGSIETFRGKLALEVTCVDRDPSALEYGRSLSAQKGLGEFITYVQGNVLRVNSADAEHHVAILSGLIDYFDFETAVSVLTKVGQQLLPDGIIMIANMRRHYLASTMSVLGDWNLVYREPDDVEAILVESGYEEVKVWLEPEGIFCLGKARKPG